MPDTVGRITALLFILACAQGPALAFDPAMVSGQVTESGTGDPISGATVAVAFNPGTIYTGTTDAQGHYEILVPMNMAIREALVEAGSPDHLPVRLNGNPDFDCFFACGGGTDGVVELEAGAILTGQDLTLSPGGGRFSGSVTAAGSGTPLAGILVIPYRVTDTGFSARFSPQFSGGTAADGGYSVGLALPPGQYHALAEAETENYVTTALGGVTCQYGQCAIAATDTLEISDEALLGDVDFSLRSGATLSGTLLPDDVSRVVRVWDGSGINLEQKLLNPGVSEWSFDRLAGGSYYLELSPGGGVNLLRQLHNGESCPFFGCDRATGTPLEIPIASTVSGIDVTLQTGGTLLGTIIDADSGQPPEASGDGNVGFFNLVTGNGAIAGGGVITASSGGVNFVTNGGVAPGEYFLRTFDSFYGRGIGNPDAVAASSEYLPGYADAAYPDVACAGVRCDLGQADTVTITAGQQTQVTMTIQRGSNISGSVVDDASDEGIGRAVVELVDAQNRRLATTVTGTDGDFVFGAFPEGSYYLRTAMSSARSPFFSPLQHAYFDRVWGADGNCSEQLCDPATGTALILDGENDVGPFELRVQTGPVISGRIFDQSSGQLITRGRVEVRTDDNRLVGVFGINWFDGRFQSTALPPGTYTLIPRVSPAFIPLPLPAASPESTDAGQARTQRQSAAGFQVELGSESVETELRVVDVGADRVFRSGFIALPFGQ